jgi:3-isopropylmalate/(R)-2-methylmalate dehydratase small subunit
MDECLIRRGRAHVLGDGVSLDDDVIPARLAAQRIMDPATLTPHLFENVDPDFARSVRPGDVVFAGRNFACGKPRLQGLIALAALDLTIVCASMPFKILRRAVARAIPVIAGVSAAHALVATGDTVEIDLTAGVLRNLTRETQAAIPIMAPILRNLVAAGGAQTALRDWLAAHPEQAAAPADSP